MSRVIYSTLRRSGVSKVKQHEGMTLGELRGYAQVGRKAAWHSSQLDSLFLSPSSAQVPPKLPTYATCYEFQHSDRLHYQASQGRRLWLLRLGAATPVTLLVLAELECYKLSLSDAEKKSNFLQSLGPDWNGYIGTLEACGSMEELFIKAAAEAGHRSTQAQRSKHGGSQAVGSGNTFAVSSHGKQGAKKGKCYNCGKRGHFKMECKSKKQFGATFGNAAASEDSNDEAETGFIFQVFTQTPGADWIIDSGASSHMTGTSIFLSNLHEMASSVVVTTASGTTLTAADSGKALLPLITGGFCTLDSVLHLPGLQLNLVSLSKVGAAGLAATFDHERCVINSGGAKLVATRRSSGPYVVTTPSAGTCAEVDYASGGGSVNLAIWHTRLGHLNARDLKALLKAGDIAMTTTQLRPCKGCAAGNLASLPFPAKKPRDLKRGQVLITTDYVGPTKTTSWDGFTGMVSMTIEPYHLAAVFPVKDKTSVTQLRALRECIANLNLEVPEAHVAVLKSDYAAQYIGGEITEFCNKNMIAQDSARPTEVDSRTANGIFIAYEKSGSYRFWVPSGHGGSVSVVLSHTAVFESSVTKSMTITLDGDLPASAQQVVASDQVPTDLGAIQEDVTITRIKKESVQNLKFEKSHNTQELALVSELQDPLTLQEAMARPDVEQWRKAINEELESLTRNGTYEEGFRPGNVRPVQTQWVFHRKTLADVSLDKYKARLVAKDFTQQFGVDYTETFSPVVRHDSIRTILALAVQLNWEHLQLDVQTAFLNSDLSEVIYVTPPADESDDKVWRQRKALYGLKQAARAW
ncbi:unnamed protein product [Phytophthora fragariaefolia]|uniref:Unnamed protein product n=1 Tax=Phytophthora fragariaefolia TaxID=1490495 RepID=A0A9W6YRG9_9STRA|nr:unnamed protein product [Phytophthora fragariaefolia]